MKGRWVRRATTKRASVTDGDGGGSSPTDFQQTKLLGHAHHRQPARRPSRKRFPLERHWEHPPSPIPHRQTLHRPESLSLLSIQSGNDRSAIPAAFTRHSAKDHQPTPSEWRLNPVHLLEARSDHSAGTGGDSGEIPSKSGSLLSPARYRRFGYRRVHVLLRRKGRDVNAKRIYRLYKEMGIQLRNKTPRRRVKSKLREDRKDAVRPNDVWAMDFVHDQLATGRKLRVLTVMDTFSRYYPRSMRGSAIAVRTWWRRWNGYAQRSA